METIKIKDKLEYFPDKKIHCSYESNVYEGIYGRRTENIAVKVFKLDKSELAVKEIEALLKFDQHNNTVKYYGEEKDNDYFYIAVERGDCNLGDFVKLCANRDVPNKNQKLRTLFGDDVKPLTVDGRPTPLLLKLFRDIVAGLKSLHESNIIHRNLKPEHIAIFKGPQGVCAKISDMAITKQLIENEPSPDSKPGGDGWQPFERFCADEHADFVGPSITTAVDMFSLGCILSFCISDGRHHPFASDIRYFDDGYLLDINDRILRGLPLLSFLNNFPEAQHLIPKLISKDPEERPTAVNVLGHPMFWDSQKRISFIHHTSDTAEDSIRKTQFGKKLNKIGVNVVGLVGLGRHSTVKRWDTNLDDQIKTILMLRQKRSYNFRNFLDLLRLHRNLFQHNNENKDKMICNQKWKWQLSEDLEKYFTKKFPKLIMEIYKFIGKNYKQEQVFKDFF